MNSQYKVKVQHENTDCYAIAHHSAYIKWVEAGRNEYFEQHGVKFNKLSELGIKILVSEMVCKFKKPVCLMDEITIFTKTLEVHKHSLIFEHTIKNDFDNTVVFKGTSKVICTDNRNRLLRTLPDYIFENLLKERVNSESCCV